MTRAHQRIIELLPAAGDQGAARLTAIDADSLVDFVLDTAEMWWRRRTCALALRGRVPEARATELLARLQDPADVSELRRAILDVLVAREVYRFGDRKPLTVATCCSTGRTEATGVRVRIARRSGCCGTTDPGSSGPRSAGSSWSC
jgi:hypothetical protein